MSLIGIFVRYIFTFGILPLFVIYLIGWPIFLIRILNKVLYIRVNDIYVFNFLIVLFGKVNYYRYFQKGFSFYDFFLLRLNLLF